MLYVRSLFINGAIFIVSFLVARCSFQRPGTSRALELYQLLIYGYG